MAAPTASIKINAMADGVTANATDDIPVNRAGTDVRITPTYIKTFIAALIAANNLSDLTNAGTARTNLGLGALAVLNSVTASLISDASANGRSLITAADYAAMRATLGVTANNGSEGVLFDHFLNIIASGSGPLGLNTTVSGGTVAAIATPDAASIGVVQCATGTGTTGRGGILGPATSIRFGGAAQTVAWRFQMPTLLDGTDTGSLWLGFGDGGGGQPTDGAYLYWDNTQTNFRCKTASNSVATDTDSTIAPQAATWYVIEIAVNAAGTSVVFNLYNSDRTSLLATKTNTTNIPTGAGRETALTANIVKSAGTNTRLLSLDYCRFAWSGVSA